MTIREMDIFVNVAELSNLTKVSEKMNLTQPSISMTIKSIEEEFNEKMFDRISKKLIVNERGRVLYEEITPILLQLKQFKERFIQNKFSGNINVAASNTIGVYALADVLYDYKKLHKHVNITHLYPEPDNIISLIYEGKVDIGFIEFELLDKNIVKELLYKDELIVVSSDKSLIEKSFYIDQLFDKEWIVREISSAVTQTFFDYLGEVKSDLNITLALEHTVAIKELLIKHKNTISILPAKSVENEIRSNKLYKIDIINMKFERNTYMIYHKNKFKNIIFESFRKFALQNIVK
ncbi:transcriptional regulator, LysR family [Arcobacter nitrofigilis DSM 7299]|uniref:Transcriptional regulator, LysR family n=1 Tax=Arcobacter nitrofigilis (strain ATCC 33309 / DSM 7299 / CCUG 15893 / LMG 7604 / NCTC 12251 / CI) TaxID=572480 RepID=D5V533_ARCNC|nr:LysR substrate-binding domain-containing protein [Arcobacter nitrofigilis]ADG91995.1 transcriptional regulator, LysR family [Arcobacter nitrofigilis DSM 7299]